MFTKRNLSTLLNRSVPDVKVKRKLLEKVISEIDVNKLVFLDECGINTDMTRHYARSKSNERAVDSTPVNTPCSTTILSSVRLNDQTVYTVYNL